MQIENGIREFVLENILFSEETFPLDDGASFLSNAIVDSLGVMELVSFVEKHYGLSVDPQEVVPDNFDSVSNLASYIRRKQTSV